MDEYEKIHKKYNRRAAGWAVGIGIGLLSMMYGGVSLMCKAFKPVANYIAGHEEPSDTDYAGELGALLGGLVVAGGSVQMVKRTASKRDREINSQAERELSDLCE
jgi:hypothetical protein